MICAIQNDQILEAMLFEGSCDTAAFCSFLETMLLPKLKPGDVLVLDNLRVHHSQAVKELLSQAGVKTLYLPPYSPDLNPIERMFSKVKNTVRRQSPRTVSEVVEAVGQALKQVTSLDIKNWIRSARIKP